MNPYIAFPRVQLLSVLLLAAPFAHLTAQTALPTLDAKPGVSFSATGSDTDELAPGEALVIPFRVNADSTRFDVRSAPDSKVTTVVFTADQIEDYRDGFAIAASYTDKRKIKPGLGTTAPGVVTLDAGDYYLGIRNTSRFTSSARAEIVLQPDHALVSDSYVSDGTAAFINATLAATSDGVNNDYVYQTFTVLEGHRYFIGGANSGTDVYLIDDLDLEDFLDGENVSFFYSGFGDGADGANDQLPGYRELHLPPGDYDLIAKNDAPDGAVHSASYAICAYAPTLDSDAASSPALTGPAILRFVNGGSQIKIKTGNVLNNSLSADSGSLRLEVFAFDDLYDPANSNQGGILLGSLDLGALDAATQLGLIKQKFNLPGVPEGDYQATLLLEEFDGVDYVVRDFFDLGGVGF